MSHLTIGILGILLFFVLIFLRIPIAFAMAFTGFIGFSILTSFDAGYRMLVTEIYNTFTSYSLSVIIMFIWMGFLAYYSGLGTRMYLFAYRLVGHLPGGLAIATQFACGAFGAICGSNTASAATMGAIALPEMKKYNYDSSLATASIAAGGVLGVLIPPSVIFILYGMTTEQNIGKLFIAGIIPGILLMLLYIASIFILTLRNPELAPPGPKASWKERLQALFGGLFEALIIFSLSIGGLFVGWFTPTEAGAVGAAGIFILGLLKRQLNFEKIKKSLLDTTKTTAMIMLIIAGAIIFGRFIAISRIPSELANFIDSLLLPVFLIMGFILLIHFILGCFIDALALILLTTPIFYPIVVTTLGYDPIWFGVIIVLIVAMGVITPPVGINVYIIKGVAANVELETIFKGIWPFLIAIIICIVLLIAFPGLATFLPNLLQ
ncbi:TRAP dicarboxylate transporter, DctM subunit, unknown substrate 3 [Candidatus Syntrophocurvum alkaliphilum]|uniref:TRAP C4-dicarboxylate transport system permease DctM subunit domain-containing protein n=1 Tax=Candidatus Syntrophocurvum alkaliphilum TaxID=2293317 RepID=A0A6I6DI24_9FIRM|nr:TRAP transporter large permease [Candidatus Syntrophocurvum alkaliphilum]QGU00409.1 TRAP dicarboxylate transporter, DctM subunit, unknown substrate 3 [Candidatus Syntrophocurvum alkaliphilum]